MCKHFSTRGIIGAYFLIQSASKSCSFIKASLNRHILKILEKVRKMSEKEFNEHRNSVVTHYSEKNKNLQDEFNRFWTNEITTFQFKLDRQEQECSLLKELTLKELKKHFKKLFHPDQANRLDVHWNSKSHKEQEESY